MKVDTQRARFTIKSYKGQFAILIKYNNQSFIAYKGALPQVKQRFIFILNNRSILTSYIEYFFKNHNVA